MRKIRFTTEIQRHRESELNALDPDESRFHSWGRCAALFTFSVPLCLCGSTFFVANHPDA